MLLPLPPRGYSVDSPNTRSWYRRFMPSLSQLHAAVVVSMLTVGCGGSGGLIPLSDLTVREIDAYCRYDVKCGLLPDFATCKALPADTSTTDQLVASVNAGRIQYDGDAAAVWIAAIADRGCDHTDVPGNGGLLAYVNTFKGMVGGGGACFIDQECVSAQCNLSSCLPTELCCSGTCTDGQAISNPVAAGGDCSAATAVCVDGSYCSYAGTQASSGLICTAGLALGQPCDPYLVASPVCLFGTNCRIGGSALGGTCMAAPAEGEDCFLSGSICNSHLDACSSNSKCLRKIALGQPCTMDSTCVDYALCVSGTCIEKKKLGEACDPSLSDGCMGSLSCNGGTCVASYAAPVACTGSCGVAGAAGATGTGESTSATCSPACTADQDCIGGSCVPSPWYGMPCATTQDCPTNTTCCDGSNETCDGTRFPSGDGENSGEFVVSADGLTVTDTITGLVWQSDGSSTRTGCSGIGDEVCTWAAAKAYCAGLALGGLSGWRLPAVTELTTIVDLTRTSPSIDPTAFPNTPAADFWTSSPDTSPYTPSLSGQSARSVLFDDGSLRSEGVNSDNLVRCVRGSRCHPVSRFVVLDGELVLDTLTNLTWQQQASATIMNWSDAQTYCSCAGLGFRLPTVRELASIVDATVTSGATINQTVFPNTPSVAFWTSSLNVHPSSPNVGPSSPYARSFDPVWEVDFSSGYSYSDDVRYYARARCVR